MTIRVRTLRTHLLDLLFDEIRLSRMANEAGVGYYEFRSIVQSIADDETSYR